MGSGVAVGEADGSLEGLRKLTTATTAGMQHAQQHATTRPSFRMIESFLEAALRGENIKLMMTVETRCYNLIPLLAELPLGPTSCTTLTVVVLYLRSPKKIPWVYEKILSEKVDNPS